tara:strand:+ start:6670 stop:7218 length:549 start_codon:yes stop_codon:yes gene_type:complete
MSINLQPFEEIELKSIERFGGAVGGDDGASNATLNLSRTPPVDIGGRPFSVVLRDSLSGMINNGTSGNMKVQVNNSNYIDPNKQGHVINPSLLGIQSVTNMLEDQGVFQLEPSSTASDFNDKWIDMPGGAKIDVTASGYVGSGAWRYMRLVGTNVTVSVTAAHIPPTLTAYVYHTGLDTMGK